MRLAREACFGHQRGHREDRSAHSVAARTAPMVAPPCCRAYSAVALPVLCAEAAVTRGMAEEDGVLSDWGMEPPAPHGSELLLSLLQSLRLQAVQIVHDRQSGGVLVATCLA